MVDPIKTSTQFQVPLKPSSHLDAPVVKPGTSFQATPKAAAQTQKPAAIQEPPKPKGDTVELSQAAQARLLHLQGMSIPDIALRLRLDIATVNSYFPKE
jgi:hypothetical protein